MARVKTSCSSFLARPHNICFYTLLLQPIDNSVEKSRAEKYQECSRNNNPTLHDIFPEHIYLDFNSLQVIAITLTCLPSVILLFSLRSAHTSAKTTECSSHLDNAGEEIMRLKSNYDLAIEDQRLQACISTGVLIRFGAIYL